MVSIEGVDYSYARPTASQLKAADKKFAVRYITTPGAQNKGISQQEYNALTNAGVEVAVVFEGGAGDMKKGKNQGVADAKAAAANLKGITGLNDNLPIYFACDFDATPQDQTAINAYLDGAASVLGINRVGLYAGYYPLKRAKAAGKVTWLWQTYAWSGGQILDGIHLYQYKNGVKLGSGTVDLCRAYKTEYGQNPYVAPKPVEKPPVVVTPPLPTPKPDVNPLPAQQAAAQDANVTFDPSLFRGSYYFKGTDKPDIYIYDPVSGKKRHVSSEEWLILKGYGHAEAYTIAQTYADKIPS